MISVTKFHPFGVEWRDPQAGAALTNIVGLTPPRSPIEWSAPQTGATLDAVSITELRAEIAKHRLAVLRGFAAPGDEEMLNFCRKLGEILEWEFGAVNELQVKEDARNYLFTRGEVPFHWDGAFVGKVPHYIFFHCRLAPPAGSGGETTFCDTTKLIGLLSADERRQFENVRITYSTEKIVHYGGSFTSPLLSRHPASGESVLRYAEPVDDLNPVRLEIDGIPASEQAAFLARMRDLLRDERCHYAHAWRQDDIVVADNHALLHGRRAFTQAAPRHLRRVNVL